MRILAFSALALGFGLTAVQLTACSNSSDDCNATATCGATAGASHAGNAGKSGGGDGNEGGANNGGTPNVAGSSNTSGTQGGGGEGGGSGACTGDVSDDAACWTTNELGVFVSSDAGDDGAGDGTKEAPFKTITKGIAAAAGKNVYVCVGTADYAEKVSLDTASDGVQIYGGFECENWTYATTRSAQVVSPSNIALRIDGLKKGVHIENVSFKAADADGMGADASSYGAFVTNSKKVALNRVRLTGGAGAKGADGLDGAKGIDGSAAGAPPVASAATCSTPPATLTGPHWENENVCGSLGGKGGDGSKSDGGSGLKGAPTEHVSATQGETGKGGLGSSDATKGVDGDAGMSGDAGTLGSAAASAGVFSISGFTLAGGKDGSAGFPGQGGGGGGASKGNATCDGATGGVGGMGGCGGGGGKAGEGGGASVGLFSWASDVLLASSLVQGGAGGAGATGGKGGQRGLGAVGGTGGGQDPDTLVALGGNGGRGGNGGPGGNGSGGTGGPSYALVYFGTQPVYDATDTELTFGTPGAAGVGGQQVSTTKAPDGFAGESDTVFEVP